MNKYIKSIIKYVVLFLYGGTVYYMVEMMWRGYSHWTMFLLGGLCFVSVGLINNIFPWTMRIELQAAVGAALITLLELVVGLVVNIWLGWAVWDYSDVPINFLGQICLPFTIIWYILSFAIIFLDDQIRYMFFDERQPTYISVLSKNYY